MTKYKLTVDTIKGTIEGVFDTARKASEFREKFYPDETMWSIFRLLDLSNCECEDKHYHDRNCVRYKDWE